MASRNPITTPAMIVESTRTVYTVAVDGRSRAFLTKRAALRKLIAWRLIARLRAGTLTEHQWDAIGGYTTENRDECDAAKLAEYVAKVARRHASMRAARRG